jgi:carbon-monoxide dehydrogenase small subunit
MTLISLTVNGRPVIADVEPRTHLADFLRDTQNLTGTHLGCEHGVCGACTLLVDGSPARSCITLAVACQNAEITTIEGLDDDEIAGELRAAFTREHGLQCGYCTPGVIISARDVVTRLDVPTEHEVRVAMSGNLCRCTGYVGIVRAIRSVIADRRSRGIAAVADGGTTALGPVGSTRAGEAIAAGVSRGEPSPAAALAVAKDSLLPNDWKPQATFEQSFKVAHPVDQVWAFFGQVAEVATCLPGVSLNGTPTDARVEGQIRVKMGPITADFQGTAEIERNELQRTGQILGSGRDRRSGSNVRGLVTYTVGADERTGETRVDVGIGYTLTGMLAQFGRSGLVVDVANRIIAAFVINLKARLAHQDGRSSGAPLTAVRELNAGSLIVSVLLTRLRRIFAWFQR